MQGPFPIICKWVGVYIVTNMHAQNKVVISRWFSNCNTHIYPQTNMLLTLHFHGM
jgi:L-asparagine transporter-like permease